MGRALSVIGVPTGAGQYSAALEGLTALNEYTLREHPETPALYDAGVVYTKESTDKWRDLTAVLKTKSGDCEALSTWRAAELRVSGEDPLASVVVYKTGPQKYHAIVLRGDHTVEDPSVKLGMKPPSGLLAAYDNWNSTVAMAPPQEDQPMVMGDNDDVACAVIGANDAPDDVEVSFVVVGTGDGFKGVIRVPFSDGRALYAETSTSGSDAEASAKAHRVLGVIGSVWDDLIVLAPSPQAQAAIRLAKNDHVQNLAKAAYGAGKKAIGRGDKPASSSTSSSSSKHDLTDAAKRFQDRHANDAPVDASQPFDDFDDGATLDHGQGFDLSDGTPMATDVMGWDLFEVNGVVCGAHELEILGAVNEALARGSTPTTVGAAARSTARSSSTSRAPARASSGSAPRASSGGGGSTMMRAASGTLGQRTGASSGPGGGSSGARAGTAAPLSRTSSGGPSSMARGTPATSPFQTALAASGTPFSASTPYAPTSPAFSPYGSPYGGASPYGPTSGLAQSAAAQFLQQRQQNAAKSALLRQSGGSDGQGGGSGGGGGGGGGGADYDGGYTAADAATAEQADADLFAHYYGNQAAQQAEEDWFNTAVETDADQFFGAVDPWTAEAMLMDDSIPAQ